MKKTIMSIIVMFLFWASVFSSNGQEFLETPNAPSWNTQNWEGMGGIFYDVNDDDLNLTSITKVATDQSTYFVVIGNESKVVYFSSNTIVSNVIEVGIILNASTTYFIGAYKSPCVSRTQANDVSISGSFPIVVNKGNITMAGGSASCLGGGWSWFYTVGDIYSINSFNVSVYGGVDTTPTLTINHNLIDETEVSETTLFEEITYNGTITNINSFFNCSLYTKREDITSHNETQLNVNLSNAQFFNYSYGFIDDDIYFRLNCSNENVTDVTDWYEYEVDTTKYINYIKSLEIQALNNLIWGEIDMIWIILFIATFLIVGIITKIYGLWVFSGFGFYLLSFKVVMENTPYSKAVMFGGIILGSLIMLLGVIAQVFTIQNDKKSKPSMYDSINYN